MDTIDLAALVPGSRILDDFVPPEDLDAEFPLPYGDNPPIEWFTEVHHDVIPGATGLITADGRFCAFSHEWDRCHNGYTADGTCWVPPRSVTANKYFHQSSVVTAEGIQIPTGAIPLGQGHAPVDVSIWDAMQHYDKPEQIRVRARSVETAAGAVMCGTITPGTTYRQVAQMRAAALSGDWRWVPELQAMEFLGPCFVVRPGLPLGLEQAAIAAALWDIERELETVVNASGEVTAAFMKPVLWTPRTTILDNVPTAVIAAAQTRPMAETSSCSCSTPKPVTAAPSAIVPTRARTAAAGTGHTYRDLDSMVSEAVKAEFGKGDSWVWVKDWDDAWVVFELESDDPIHGFRQIDYMVNISIAPEGVSVDRASIVEVTTIFAPAPGSELPMQAPVTADATSDNAAAIADLATVVEGIAGQLAQMASKDLTPAETVAELPAAPAFS